MPETIDRVLLRNFSFPDNLLFSATNSEDDTWLEEESSSEDASEDSDEDSDGDVS